MSGILLTFLFSCAGLQEEAADADCGEQVWPSTMTGDHIMIADTGGGKVVLVNRTDGDQDTALCMSSLLPDDCADLQEDGSASCQVFGINTDDDGLLLSFSNTSPERVVSGVLHFETDTDSVSWRIDGLRFPIDHPLRETCLTEDNKEPLCRLRMPHAAQWSPDGDLVIADTLNDRVLLLRPPDSGTGVADVVAVLDTSVPGWGAARWPNNVQVLSRQHEVYLLVTYKGSQSDITGDSRAGRIILWDVTDISAPEQAWAFPERGHLAAVHGATIQSTGTETLLLYAHSFGSSDSYTGETGSVGLAEASLDAPPVYLGDVITTTDEPLGFVRSVQIIDSGSALLVTDSGCERPEQGCSRPSRVMELNLQIPEPTGLSGAFSDEHTEQSFVVFPMIGHTHGEDLRYPFRAELMSEPTRIH